MINISVRSEPMGASSAGILPILFCAAVLAALGFPSTSLAQSYDTVFVNSDEWNLIDRDLKEGCRTRIFILPSFGTPSHHQAFNETFGQTNAPISETYLHKLNEAWAKLPACRRTEASRSEPPWAPAFETFRFDLGGGVVETSSTTKITSPTDQQKIKQDPTQAILVARANVGPWFLTGQVTFAGTPHGSFTDVFPAFPAANFTATVNSGNVYGFNGDAGYTVFRGAGWNVGIFAGYYSFNEELYGTFPGFTGVFALLNDHWRAGEGGVMIDKAFTVGTQPFDLNVTVAGLYDNLRAGLFNGNGGGVRVNGTLSFPLGPVVGNVYAQYADLNASSSNTGVPLQFRDQVWTVGFGLSCRIGAPTPSSPSMVAKATWSK